MKSIFISFILLFIFTLTGRAQTSPLDPVCTFNYQAVARDANDQVLADKNMKVQLTVLDGPGGNALYIEQHDVLTSSLGLFEVEVGAGFRVGGILTFDAIPWVIRKHFLKVEVDINGGTSFEDLGVSPILAVPIAVQAKVAAFATHTLDTIKMIDTLRVDTLRVKTACIDTLKSNVICVDSIKVKCLVLQEADAKISIFDSISGESIDIISVDPVKGLTVTTAKVNTDSLCLVGGTIDILDPDFGLTGELGFSDGKAFLDVDNIITDSLKTNTICSFDKVEFKNSRGEPIFIFDPDADPNTEYAMTVKGNIMVNGILQASQKQFVINHPLDPDNKYLRHASVESSEMINVYSGTVILDADGQARVQMDDWFEALNRDFRYQLTCIGSYAPVYIASEVKDNAFEIAGGLAGQKVSWELTGVRKDTWAVKNPLQVESNKK